MLHSLSFASWQQSKTKDFDFNIRVFFVGGKYLNSSYHPDRTTFQDFGGRWEFPNIRESTPNPIVSKIFFQFFEIGKNGEISRQGNDADFTTPAELYVLPWVHELIISLGVARKVVLPILYWPPNKIIEIEKKVSSAYAETHYLENDPHTLQT